MYQVKVNSQGIEYRSLTFNVTSLWATILLQAITPPIVLSHKWELARGRAGENSPLIKEKL